MLNSEIKLYRWEMRTRDIVPGSFCKMIDSSYKITKQILFEIK